MTTITTIISPPVKPKMHIYDLPHEVLIMIMSKIQLQDRLQVREVSVKMRSLVESELKLVRSLDVCGRSLKSVLDFVKDSKAKDVPCPEAGTTHQFHSHNSISRIISFDRICLLISKYFDGLVCLRLHKVTITFEGLDQLLQSQAWKGMEHLVIRSCYMENDGLDDFLGSHEPDWWISRQPVSLKHAFYFPITNNQSLISVIRLMLVGYKCDSIASSWLSYSK